jgi:hypothetical protein
MTFLKNHVVAGLAAFCAHVVAAVCAAGAVAVRLNDFSAG